MTILTQDDIDQITMLVLGQRSKYFKVMEQVGSISTAKIMMQDIELQLWYSHDFKHMHKLFSILQKLWLKLPIARPLTNYIGELVGYDGNKEFYVLSNFRSGAYYDAETLYSHKEGHHIGFEIGDFLGQLHQQKFKKFGQLDENLEIAHSYDFSVDMLSTQFASLIKIAEKHNWVIASDHQNLANSFVEKIKPIMDWSDQAQLVHSQIKASNLKVSNGHLVEVINWDQLQAAHPSFEFAHLVGAFNSQNDFEAIPFLKNILDQYYIYHPHLPKEWFQIVKLIAMLRDFSKVQKQFSAMKQKQWFDAQMKFLLA